MLRTVKMYHTHSLTQLFSDEQTFKKCRNYLKILGARRVTCGTFHTGVPQILGDTLYTLVATATWRPGFVHPCSCYILKVPNRLAQRRRGTQFKTRLAEWHSFLCFIHFPGVFQYDMLNRLECPHSAPFVTNGAQPTCCHFVLYYVPCNRTASLPICSAFWLCLIAESHLLELLCVNCTEGND
jgi:hypothetical protein